MLSSSRRSYHQLAQPQAIRAVFFDVGFTLLAPYPSVAEVVRDVCTQRGIAIETDCLQEQIPHVEALFAQLTHANPHTWGDEQAITRIWLTYFTELLRPCLKNADEKLLHACADDAQRAFDEASAYALYPDVYATLAALKARGLTLGVISDWGINLGMIMRHHDLTQYFDFAVISAAMRRAKPDPELYHTALQRADAIPDYTIHVGDSYVRDVLGARLMGITGVMIDRTRLTRPDDVDCPLIYDLYELLDLLEIAHPAAASSLVE
ncbi:MAG: HAD-IA family hydrolase [Ktedonobacterales bacterium]